MVEADVGVSVAAAYLPRRARMQVARTPPDPDDIKTLRHGIRALRLATTRAWVSSGDVAADCRISRAAAYRILQTLQEAGYLLRTGGGNGVRYVVTQRLRELSGGYDAGMRLLDAAIPLMTEWTEHHGWPLALATPAGDRATLRFVTDPIATRVLMRYKAGVQSTALTSASGLICLAHQPPELQELVVRRLVNKTPQASGTGFSRSQLMARLQRVRQDGFVIFGPVGLREESLAIPVWLEGSMSASVALRYMQVADGGPAGRARRLELLKDLRDRIVAKALRPRDECPEASPLSRSNPHQNIEATT